MGQRRWRRWRWCSQSVGVGRYSRPPCKASFLRVPPRSSLFYHVGFSPRTFSFRPLLSFPVFLHFGVCVCVCPSLPGAACLSSRASFVPLCPLSSLPKPRVSSLSFASPTQRVGGCSSIVCSRNTLYMYRLPFLSFSHCQLQVVTATEGPRTEGTEKRTAPFGSSYN